MTIMMKFYGKVNLVWNLQHIMGEQLLVGSRLSAHCQICAELFVVLLSAVVCRDLVRIQKVISKYFSKIVKLWLTLRIAAQNHLSLFDAVCFFYTMKS